MEPKQQLKLELREPEAEGIYANIALITHSPSEFVIDFARLLPGLQKSRVHARVIMAPRNLKQFLTALKDNIKELSTEEAIEALEALAPVKYNYLTDEDDLYVGFIAEDVPELVASKDRKGMSAMDVVAVLTRVLQEQQKSVQEQAKTVEELKKANTALRKEIAKLERKIK